MSLTIAQALRLAAAGQLLLVVGLLLLRDHRRSRVTASSALLIACAMGYLALPVLAHPAVPEPVRQLAGGAALAVPFAFGIAAHLLDAGIRWAATGNGWFVAHGAWIGAAVLAGAGIFQWSALKYRCLDQCRTPFGFVASRWHGLSPARDAFRIGIDHGMFCVGCCWALMLTMFVVGVGSVGWMLALAALMAAEKNLPFGPRLRTPIGLALLAGSAGVLLTSA